MDFERPLFAGTTIPVRLAPTTIEDLPDEILIKIMSNFRVGHQNPAHITERDGASQQLEIQHRATLLLVSQVSRKFKNCAQEILFQDVGVGLTDNGDIIKKYEEPKRLAMLFDVLRRNPGLARKVNILHLHVLSPTVLKRRGAREEGRRAAVEWIIPDLTVHIHGLVGIPDDMRKTWLEMLSGDFYHEALAAGLLSVIPNLQKLFVRATYTLPLLSTLAQLTSMPILGTLRHLRLTIEKCERATYFRQATGLDLTASLVYLPRLWTLTCNADTEHGSLHHIGHRNLSPNLTELTVFGGITGKQFASVLGGFKGLIMFDWIPHPIQRAAYYEDDEENDGEYRDDEEDDDDDSGRWGPQAGLGTLIEALEAHRETLRLIRIGYSGARDFWSIMDSRNVKAPSFAAFERLEWLIIDCSCLLNCNGLALSPERLAERLARALPRSLQMLELGNYKNIFTRHGRYNLLMEPLEALIPWLDEEQYPNLRTIRFDPYYREAMEITGKKKKEVWQKQIMKYDLFEKFGSVGIIFIPWYFGYTDEGVAPSWWDWFVAFAHKLWLYRLIFSTGVIGFVIGFVVAPMVNISTPLLLVCLRTLNLGNIFHFELNGLRGGET
ncbi:hypothetical protein BU16DRAFT_378963 [Lophium mytilinum]|uniref:Uncharacterized protein n=1 Tax=Lophium mytilinum TaxID=390894 RepID=A0A6A6QRR4_9PEZI|nr:hypothetical protein BU16DRAFT_378963 [Lophium mytilinum]